MNPIAPRRPLVVLLVASIFVVEACSSKVSAPAPASPPAAQTSTDSDEHRGIPRWVWWTAGSVVVATTLAMVFYYVVVPGAAENAGKAAGNQNFGGNGSGGLLGLGGS